MDYYYIKNLNVLVAVDISRWWLKRNSDEGRTEENEEVSVMVLLNKAN